MKIQKICHIIPARAPLYPTDTVRSLGHNNGLHSKLFGIGARFLLQLSVFPILHDDFEYFVCSHHGWDFVIRERSNTHTLAVQSDKKFGEMGDGRQCNKYAGHWQWSDMGLQTARYRNGIHTYSDCLPSQLARPSLSAKNQFPESQQLGGNSSGIRVFVRNFWGKSWKVKGCQGEEW